MQRLFKFVGLLCISGVLLMLASCATLQLKTPAETSGSVLVLPTETIMDVVSARYHFKYFYEITRIDDSTFSYTAWIRFPVSNNIVLIDELPAGEYRARRVGYIQVGVAEHQYGSRSVPFGQPFTLERGKMVIFPQSLRLTMRNENPGHFATIIYNHSLQPTSREQKDAIEAVLKKQGNFALWEFQDS